MAAGVPQPSNIIELSSARSSPSIKTRIHVGFRNGLGKMRRRFRGSIKTRIRALFGKRSGKKNGKTHVVYDFPVFLAQTGAQNVVNA